jgi:hypothetical protein
LLIFFFFSQKPSQLASGRRRHLTAALGSVEQRHESMVAEMERRHEDEMRALAEREREVRELEVGVGETLFLFLLIYIF